MKRQPLPIPNKELRQIVIKTSDYLRSLVLSYPELNAQEIIAVRTSVTEVLYEAHKQAAAEHGIVVVRSVC